MKRCTYCGREQYARGLCQAHYRQQYRGAPLSAVADRSDPMVPLSLRLPRAVLAWLGDRPRERIREILTDLMRKDTK